MNVKCAICDKELIAEKDEIHECCSCHKKFCYECSLDYTYWKDMSGSGEEDIIHCKKCALKIKSDGTAPAIDKTEEKERNE